MRDGRYYPRPRRVALLRGRDLQYVRDETVEVPRRSLTGDLVRNYIVAWDGALEIEVIVGHGDWARYVVPTTAELEALM